MAANLVWMASCLPACLAFQKALRDPEKAQARILRSILAANAGTEFGRKHSFATIRDVREYQTRVPACTYDEIAPSIDRICAGERRILTAEPVDLFERTSGSSSASKYIPYTASLRREFQQAIRAWLFDLYRSNPRLLLGRSYWLITPLSRDQEITPGGIPVGFDNDADYLGSLERKIAEALFAVPGELAQVPEIESSIYLTLRFLMQVEDLALISVWNPTYLAILMTRLQDWAPRLLHDLRHGTASCVTAGDLPTSLKRRLRADPNRTQRLQDILLENGRLTARDLWPHLSLISCWTSGAARQSLHEIEVLFPGVTIQGKGLLATEGVATIPWREAHGCLPALTSHFYEFLPLNGGRARLVHELEQGESYSLLLTTGGGLYRYQLGDVVRVTDFHHTAPVLEFAGRNDGVSDLRGEKLSPAFVQACLEEALSATETKARFAMLAPQDMNPPGYVLHLESASHPAALGLKMEMQLRKNPHYDYCRRLGQLAPLQVYWIAENAQTTYLHRCVELGQRAGNVNPTSLHRATGWEHSFIGHFIDPIQRELAPC